MNNYRRTKNNYANLVKAVIKNVVRKIENPKGWASLHSKGVPQTIGKKKEIVREAKEWLERDRFWLRAFEFYFDAQPRKYLLQKADRKLKELEEERGKEYSSI